MKALAAVAMLLVQGVASPWVRGPLYTDKVVVRDVVDPKVGSGILAIFAKVTATGPERKGADYFILYMGAGQTLPSVGAGCEISYRYGRLAEWTDRGVNNRLVESFACDDGRHWPDGTPPGP
jgi:hypothetical protein